MLFEVENTELHLRLDYISDTSEVWLTFHSDFSITAGGFHAMWSTVQLTGCPEMKIYEPQGEIFSPNFPNYYLPQLNCTYIAIAPGKPFLLSYRNTSYHVISAQLNDGRIDHTTYDCDLYLMKTENMRVWIKFHVLEIGSFPGRQLHPCRDEYVRIAGLDATVTTLCGAYNLSRETLQFISDGNVIKLQLISRDGKQGRGFHASYRFGKSYF